MRRIPHGQNSATMSPAFAKVATAEWLRDCTVRHIGIGEKMLGFSIVPSNIAQRRYQTENSV
jgi:hypothetical protein